MVAVDPVQRRREIVEAAFGLVAEGGVEAATMRRIATAAAATTGRGHLVGSLVDEVRGRRIEDRIALSIIATVEGLCLRLMVDCTSRTRSDARQALDDALLT